MKMIAIVFVLMFFSGNSLACGMDYYSTDNKHRNKYIVNFEDNLKEGDAILNLSTINHYFKDTTNPLVKFYIGCALLSNNEVERAMGKFVESSNDGVLASKLFLAGLYIEGELVAQNFSEAYRLYADVASNHKNTFAMIRTANLLYAGLGVNKDIDKAKNILVEASLKGSGEAYFQLGVVALTSEDDLPIKYSTVIMNFDKAIELGYSKAELELAKFRLFDGISATEKKRGIDSIKSLSIRGNEEAQLLLGKLYLFGQEKILDKNPEQAITWLTTIAEGGNFEAQAMLGLAYSKMANSIESAKVAEKWLIEATKSNDDNHKKLLAKFYINYSKANPEYQGLGEEILLKLQ